MFSLGITGKVIAGSVATILLLGGAFLWYFSWSQDRLSASRDEIAAERLAKESAIDSFDTMKEQLERGLKNIEELRRKNREVTLAANELKQLLSKHDLGYLSAEKPNLIQLRANRATKKVMQELRDITQQDWVPGEDND